MARSKPDTLASGPAPLADDAFECRQCGWCCTGEGYVSVTEAECRRIAQFLEIPLDDFLEQYTHEMVGYERWLIDGEGNDVPCIFLEREEDAPARCRIEPVKPQQCRDFPMRWTRSDARRHCPAIRARRSKGRRS